MVVIYVHKNGCAFLMGKLWTVDGGGDSDEVDEVFICVKCS